MDRSKKYNKRNFLSILELTLRIRRILRIPEVSRKVVRIIMVRILRVKAGWTGTFFSFWSI